MTKARQRQPKRRTMTNEMLAALRRKSKRYPVPVPQKLGLYVRVMPEGRPHVFVVVARGPDRRQVWKRLGDTDQLPTIALAEAAAEEAIKHIKKGEPAVATPPAPIKPDSVAYVAAEWTKRHVAKNELRTADEIQRILERYVLPRWGALPFAAIKRSMFNHLLNEIEDAHGAHMADNVAVVLRSIGGWYRDVADDYVSPFVGHKKRVPEHKRSRDRVLDDAEIGKVWKAAEAPNAGAYGSLVRLLLLTGQRLSVVVGMRWSDIDENGVWTIRKSHAREKENGGRIRLPKLALDIVNAMPKFIGDDDVFSKHRSYSHTDLKKRFDERCGVTGWRTHDLRRTARTLMSRVKVDRAIAERVLGHKIGSQIEQTYDRFAYEKEKSAALRRLAAQIEKIVHPPAPKPKRKRQPKRSNVVPLRAVS